MANDLNQCNFIGRLGKDPETKYMASGAAVCSFSIAVGWKTKDKEGAEWVNVTAFEKLGEICNTYLKKGSLVYISGRMKTEKYDDKEGVTRYVTKIIAERMQMLGGRDDAQQSAPRSAPAKPAAQKAAPTGFDDMDDDLPF